MRKLCAIAFLLLFCCGLSAQSSSDKNLEVFGGYSFLHEQTSKDLKAYDLDHVNSQGWHIGATQYVNSWFGATMDFSGQYAKIKSTKLMTDLGIPTSEADRFYLSHQFYSYMFGPQIAYRRAKSGFVPFANFQLGAATFKVSESSALRAIPIDATLLDSVTLAALDELGVGASLHEAQQTKFAYGANVGAVIPVHHNWGIRAEFRYLRTQFNNLNTDRQNNLGAQVSLSYKF